MVGQLFTTGQALSSLRPGIHDFWGLGFNRYPTEYTQIFELLTSNMAWERDVNMYGLGLPKTRKEGAASEMDGMGEGWKYDYTHIEYANSFKISHQAILYNLYMKIAEEGFAELGVGFREAKEWVHARLFNSCISSSITYADGQPLLSSSHLLSTGGTYSNMPSVVANLSQKALEDAVTSITKYVDDRGKKRLVKPRKILVHPKNWADIKRILNSTLMSGTPNNDINPISGSQVFSQGDMVYNYLDEGNANSWFILTDCPKGFRSFQSEALVQKTEEETLTDSIICRAYESYSCGVTDTMAVYGSAGTV